MTERLYHADSLLLAFEAEVLRHGNLGERASVVLDRTAFYPESGGQMADRGELHGLPVVDVQADDDGIIHHVLDGALPAPGTRVRGEVERSRRRVHMALHTAQHVLSRALELEAKAATVSARLGETACTIDVDRAAWPEAQLERAEALTNALVDDDVPVRAWFPEPNELAGLPLRREAKVSGAVRVVAVGDFDLTPCGGTHCRRSAEIGLVSVTALERYKGGMRITFAAGERARRELGAEARALRGLGQALSCPPLGVAEAVERLRAELATARADKKGLQAELAKALAASLATRGDRVIAAIPEASLELLREITRQLTAAPNRVALLAGATADGTQVVAARGSAANFDCGEFVRRLTSAHGGRGGGRPDRAEGRLPAGIDWPALAAALLAE